MYLHKNAHGGRDRHKLEILCEQQNHRCCYCGVRFVDGDPMAPAAPSIEHVVRICDGGARTWDNEVAACRWCNSTRGDILPALFFEARAHKGHPPVFLTRKEKLRRKRKRRRYVRGWQSQMALVGHDVSLGSFREVWPQIERPSAQ
jgi:5-methylcytosine-specific restriction endonuclease McrA